MYGGKYFNWTMHLTSVHTIYSGYDIYSNISIKYLLNYVNAIYFRYNKRNTNMFDKILKQSIIM